jgi:hypothetical protein
MKVSHYRNSGSGDFSARTSFSDGLSELTSVRVSPVAVYAALIVSKIQEPRDAEDYESSQGKRSNGSRDHDPHWERIGVIFDAEKLGEDHPPIIARRGDSGAARA